MTIRASFIITVFFLATISGCDTSSDSSDEFLGIFPEKNITEAYSYSAESNGNALLIWQDGELLFEEYEGQNFNGNSNHLLFSGSKSFTGILAALGVRDGYFTFDTTLSEFIEEWTPESERGSITIRQLLNLTSGIETFPIGQAPEYTEWINADMEFERGSTFTYGPGPFIIFAHFFEQASGKDPLDYLDEELFTPLGTDRGFWFEVDGRANFAYGASYTALNWLQIGILLANKGTIDGTEIIPESIFSELVTPSDAAPAYGITFWLNEMVDPESIFAERVPGSHGLFPSSRLISDAAPDDLFMKSGALGQKLYIIPSLNTVILRFGKLPDNSLTNPPQNQPNSFSDHHFFSLLFNGVELP